MRCEVRPVTAVLIHASGIHVAQGRRNWEHTIAATVDFRAGRVADSLAPWERTELERLHSDGRARCWGTHSYYSAQMARLAAGDVVIFTGRGRVLAIGRIGLLTDSVALADALWPHHPRHGSYRHAYSLAPLDFVDIPYPEFRTRGGFGVADDFRGLRVLTDARADEILAAFADEIPWPVDAPAHSPIERDLLEAQDYGVADAALAAELSWVRELRLEIRSVGDAHVRARAASTMHRGENLMVHHYVETLPPGSSSCRYDTAIGVTDLNVHYANGRHELVEAKSSSSRTHVRQALAQLLDYAPALGDAKPDSLAVLLPSRPSDSAVALLHRYGVDCVFRREDGSYERHTAPPETAAAISALW